MCYLDWSMLPPVSNFKCKDGQRALMLVDMRLLVLEFDSHCSGSAEGWSNGFRVEDADELSAKMLPRR